MELPYEINKKTHEKIKISIQNMLIDTRMGLPYYGYFALNLNFFERNDIPTCAVNVTEGGLCFYYNTEFLNSLPQTAVNFVVIHELLHLFWDHISRIKSSQFDHKLSNIAQDMIINYTIVKDFVNEYITSPKTDDDKEMCVYLPNNYTGLLIYEDVYKWLEKELEKEANKENNINVPLPNNNSSGLSSTSTNDSDDIDSAGDSNGDGIGNSKSSNTCTNTQKTICDIFNDLKNDDFDGSYMDKHIEDEVDEETKQNILKKFIDRVDSMCEGRGIERGNSMFTLEKITASKKDYISKIIKLLSDHSNGNKKYKTIIRPNRKGISGLKGKKKTVSILNCVLDTSGSMNASIERVLSVIFKNNIHINLIQIDTEVNSHTYITNKNQIQKTVVKGGGGTVLQPSIEYINKNKKLSSYNTIILTDGMTDRLNFDSHKGKVLIVTTHILVPLKQGYGNVTQIKIGD